MEIRHLPGSGLRLLNQIDRSEVVDYAYDYIEGELEQRSVNWNVPNWDPEGVGPHAVATVIATWRPVVESGGRVIGAFEGDDLLGLALVHPELEPGMAWLALLYVTAGHRGTGIGSALWREAESLVSEWGAERMYVSSAPSGPTVDFYRARGCVLAEDPHPELYDKEPDDIHFVRVF